jgi:S-DNA-T family DNA segregation ATPase FtsK/SpoIIIE
MMPKPLRAYLEAQADRVEAMLAQQKAPGRVTGGTVGPRLIRFFLDPAPDVRYSQIRRLADDVALALHVNQATVKRDEKGVVIEFENPNPRPVTLVNLLPQVLKDENGKPNPLPDVTALLGLTGDGVPLLARLPSPSVAHVLIAGTTGSGKSVLMRTMAASLMLAFDPGTVRIAAIDPKARTFPEDLQAAHLLRPVVSDPGEAAELLGSLTRLMEARDRSGEDSPAVVVCIDELADLIMQSGDHVTQNLTRLLQRGRGAGIHVVAATQRPSAAILSGLMRANFPMRLVGKVVSANDARIASGRGGTDAHMLTGRGDFLAVMGGDVHRFQAAFVGTQELTQALAKQRGGGAVRLDLPEAPTYEDPDPQPDDVAMLAQRLRPWWEKNGGDYGAKTAAVKYLFGEDAEPAGYYWQQTMNAISQIEAVSTSST